METNGTDANRFSRSCHCVSIRHSAGDCTLFHGVGVIMEHLFLFSSHTESVLLQRTSYRIRSGLACMYTVRFEAVQNRDITDGGWVWLDGNIVLRRIVRKRDGVTGGLSEPRKIKYNTRTEASSGKKNKTKYFP